MGHLQPVADEWSHILFEFEMVKNLEVAVKAAPDDTLACLDIYDFSLLGSHHDLVVVVKRFNDPAKIKAIEGVL